MIENWLYFSLATHFRQSPLILPQRPSSKAHSDLAPGQSVDGLVPNGCRDRLNPIDRVLCASHKTQSINQSSAPINRFWSSGLSEHFVVPRSFPLNKLHKFTCRVNGSHESVHLALITAASGPAVDRYWANLYLSLTSECVERTEVWCFAEKIL